MTDPGNPPDKPFRLGILYVHGIGEQRHGETLRNHADPLIRWIRSRLRARWEQNQQEREQVHEEQELADKKPDPWPEEFVVVDSGTFSGDHELGPHLDLSLYPEPLKASEARTEQAGEDGDKVPERWRLAECCWAESFPSPSAREVILWSLPVVAVAVVAHFARPLAPDKAEPEESSASKESGPVVEAAFAEKSSLANESKCASPRKKFWAVLKVFVLVVPVILATSLAMLVLLLLSVIPIERVKAFVALAQQKLALVLGDSYVFVQSPSRRSVILSKFREDLQRLSQVCDEVIVIGHSQGAAVSFHGICSSRPPENLKGLITLGAGVNKLWELYRFRDSKFSVPLSKVLLVLGLVIAFALGLSFFSASIPTYLLAVVPYLLLCLFFYGATRVWNRKAEDERRRFSNDLSGKSVPTWHDFYATHDPVSNGPLPWSFQCARKTEVTNFASLTKDHVSYTANRHEFVPGVIKSINELTERRLLLPDEAPLLEESCARRRFFVNCLRAARWALAAGLILTVVLAPEWPQNVAQKLQKFLGADEAGWLGQGWPPIVACAGVLLGALYWAYSRFWTALLNKDIEDLMRDPTARAPGKDAALIGTTLYVAVLAMTSAFGELMVRKLAPDKLLLIGTIVVVAIPCWIIFLSLSRARQGLDGTTQQRP